MGAFSAAFPAAATEVKRSRTAEPGRAALERAIVQTLAYADVFDYPLTADEVHRYLIGARASRGTIRSILSDGGRVLDTLARTGRYYTLAGRESAVETRRARSHTATLFWRRAIQYGRLIGSLPFVRMVAVTGALAMDNLADDDIDYLIVTEPGRLWLCRALVVGVVRAAALRGIELCPNYFLSENVLELEERNLFTAHEVAQMVPLAGMATYQRLRELNRWSDVYLPNAGGPPRRLAHTEPSHARTRRIVERTLRSRVANPIEYWEMHRKMRKLGLRSDGHAEASFGPDWCKGHFGDHGQLTLSRYHARLEQLGALWTGVTDTVLFGQSYFLRFDPKLWAAMHPYPPLGTLYAASYLRRRGYDVALFDAMLAESEIEWDQAILRNRPRVAVLYEDNFNYLSKMCLLRMRQAAFAMVDMAKKRGCMVVVAGSDATDHAEAYLDAGADYVLIGEGEETLAELLGTVLGNAETPLESIPGLAYRKDGKLQITQRRPDIKELDALPFPAWDLVDVAKYRGMWMERHGFYSMNVATSRGCPYHCNWCAKPIWGQRYHVRSADNVASELAWLKETFAPDHIWFVDDIFGLIPGWMPEFATLVEQKHARLPFKSLQRADLILKGDTIDALARAGAQRVWIGAESGSQKILDAMDKGTHVEDIYMAARRLRAAGIEVGFFLQFGYPGETRADVEKTLQMVRDCNPDDIGMSVSYPLPGTRFFAAVQHELGSQQNWRDSDDLAMLYHGPFSTAFYRWLHRVLHREFRAQRAWTALRPTRLAPWRMRSREMKLLRTVLYAKLALPVLRLELNRRARAPHQGLINLIPVEAAPE